MRSLVRFYRFRYSVSGIISHKSALITPAVSAFLVGKATHLESGSTITSKCLSELVGGGSAESICTLWNGKYAHGHPPTSSLGFASGNFQHVGQELTILLTARCMPGLPMFSQSGSQRLSLPHVFYHETT